MDNDDPKPIEVIPIPPPPAGARVRRDARFATDGERRNRYHLPSRLESGSPVVYRTRPSLTREEAELMLRLLSMRRPEAFEAAPDPVRESELFEEVSLGLLSSRQSTNFKGHRATLVGGGDVAKVQELLGGLDGLEAAALDGASHAHLVFTRPYRTPFTMLLTLVGHSPVLSLATVPLRIWRKKLLHADDIPTIGYLQHLHMGILADAMERAAVVASGDRRRAQVFMAPFCGEARRRNRAVIRELESLGGLSRGDRAKGWRLGLVAQVGAVRREERVGLPVELCRKAGAALLSFRSERIQPGVNQEEKAPPQYASRQSMRVPDDLTVMCGRAAYNAFAHWTGCDRERAKELVLLERIDVLTPNGKARLREVRAELLDVTERVVKRLPLWADLPVGRAFSRNAARGKKAFALAGQRIYVGGLSADELAREGLDWDLGVRAFGALASRSSLVAEIMGCVDLPADCDLLAGICLMAGPVNQNDIGKTYYGVPDLLAKAFPGRTPTSLLVWTLKAKTVADPIGNEEQLLNQARKGALVDLRCAPHELALVRRGGRLEPMRSRGGRTSSERAFGDVDNFVRDAGGVEIPGNRGEAWPKSWRDEPVWAS